jgi:hypothetical protein
MHGAPIPEWLARAIIDKSEESRDWNGVLGRLHPKNEKRQKRQQKKLINPVWTTAIKLIAAGNRIDDGMFEKIGQRLKIKPAMAKRIYYSIPPLFREISCRPFLVHPLPRPLLAQLLNDPALLAHGRDEPINKRLAARRKRLAARRIGNQLGDQTSSQTGGFSRSGLAPKR